MSVVIEFVKVTILAWDEEAIVRVGEREQVNGWCLECWVCHASFPYRYAHVLIWYVMHFVNTRTVSVCIRNYSEKLS